MAGPRWLGYTESASAPQLLYWPESSSARPSIAAITEPLKFREFRLFWIATAISFTGDQLTFIAMPWLVLKLTGDPLVMGTMIAVAAVPRAIFMLVGGVVTDTYSPRVVLLVSNLVRMGLMAALAAFTFTGQIDVWLIYGIAFLFGVADAFMFPAASAFPPRLLPAERLAAGNSLTQGTAQLTLVLGPLAAGGLIASLGSAEQSGLEDSAGLSLVFAVDALTFLVPIAILLMIRDRYPPDEKVPGSVMATLMEGLRYTWNDVPLRSFAIFIGMYGLVFRGPFMVGIPAFADAYLSEGAAAFGIIMSALGTGSIAGVILAGTTTHLRPNRFGTLLLADFMLFGGIMLAMTMIQNTWMIAAVVLVASVLDGYVIIVLTTWVQQRVPREKLGRVMSVIMLASQGLFPISAAAAGVLAGWDVLYMLMGTGLFMIGIAVVGVWFRPVRRMGYR